MVIDNATQTFILSIVDYNQEYNTKLILFCILYAYFLIMLWGSHKIIPFGTPREEVLKVEVYKQMTVKVMRIVSIVFLVTLPLVLAIFMYREFDIDEMIRYMIIGYGVATPTGLVIWFTFGKSWVMDLLAMANIDFPNRDGTIVRKKER